MSTIPEKSLINSILNNIPFDEKNDYVYFNDVNLKCRFQIVFIPKFYNKDQIKDYTNLIYIKYNELDSFTFDKDVSIMGINGTFVLNNNANKYQMLLENHDKFYFLFKYGYYSGDSEEVKFEPFVLSVEKVREIKTDGNLSKLKIDFCDIYSSIAKTISFKEFLKETSCKSFTDFVKTYFKFIENRISYNFNYTYETDQKLDGLTNIKSNDLNKLFNKIVGEISKNESNSKYINVSLFKAFSYIISNYIIGGVNEKISRCFPQLEYYFNKTSNSYSLCCNHKSICNIFYVLTEKKFVQETITQSEPSNVLNNEPILDTENLYYNTPTNVKVFHLNKDNFNIIWNNVSFLYDVDCISTRTLKFKDIIDNFENLYLNKSSSNNTLNFKCNIIPDELIQETHTNYLNTFNVTSQNLENNYTVNQTNQIIYKLDIELQLYMTKVLSSIVLLNNMYRFKIEGSMFRHPNSILRIVNSLDKSFKSDDESSTFSFDVRGNVEDIFLYITHVKHIFEDNKYYNEVSATKFYL